VLIVVENWPAGMDNRVVKQIWSLVRNGYAVRAITQKHPKNEIYRNCPDIHLLEYPPPPEGTKLAGYLVEYGYSFVMAAAFSVKVLVRERIDVVQFCQPPDFYFLLAPLFRWAGARVLVDQRDLLPELYEARYGRANGKLLAVLHLFEALSQRSADKTLCVNDYLQKRVREASGITPGGVSVVRNGPVLARVAAAAPDGMLKRGHQHLCCWVGEIGRQDRVDLLIRSVHHLVHRLGRTDAMFAVIGGGECLSEVEALARELDVEEWVHFTGMLSSEQVFQYLATADIGLDASLQFEVSPVKAMEYMAFGLPMVAFDLPETRAVVDGAALFAEPGDIPAHARNIDALLADPPRRQRLGKAGRARVREDLAWEHQAVTYVDAVAKLIRRARARRRLSRRRVISWLDQLS
jgi:glycosyltransferase involved in cell wall biosynthesis